MFLTHRSSKHEFIKVLDFGIAKITWADPDEGVPAITDTGSVMGTPHYMSPEQCQAQPLDARSDVYSLGCVMYCLATGSVPFQAPTPVTIMLMHVQNEPVPPRELNPTLSPSLEHIILINGSMAKQKSNMLRGQPCLTPL